MPYQNVRQNLIYCPYLFLQDIFTDVQEDLDELHRKIRRFRNPSGLDKSEAVQSCAELGQKAFGEKVIEMTICLRKCCQNDDLLPKKLPK